MKTFICAICGKEVSKRQSLSIGDGKRARRCHEETQQASVVEQQKVKDKSFLTVH